jgi:plasmid stabilization system protein ParE
MRAIRFLAGVEADLDEAVSWFDREGELGAAEHFLSEFRVTVDRIATHGHIYRKSHGAFRHLKFPRFSYLAFFREEDDTFVIALVINAARNPALIQALLATRR